ncbi:hypothetical protein BV25DRAFT_1628433 [Artomyces pyxidatus]|uniref:Uncharacterized protein n=1 Tax=Artomyces pyxidatus TaxID=48021 RepID=A0ACB8SJI3_9AGAM|nr:hypothetical protein BV25DRAFT_1628433 [Artomyces pyxidatus]
MSSHAWQEELFDGYPSEEHFGDLPGYLNGLKSTVEGDELHATNEIQNEQSSTPSTSYPAHNATLNPFDQVESPFLSGDMPDMATVQNTIDPSIYSLPDIAGQGFYGNVFPDGSEAPNINPFYPPLANMPLIESYPTFHQGIHYDPTPQRVFTPGSDMSSLVSSRPPSLSYSQQSDAWSHPLSSILDQASASTSSIPLSDLATLQPASLPHLESAPHPLQLNYAASPVGLQVQAFRFGAGQDHAFVLSSLQTDASPSAQNDPSSSSKRKRASSPGAGPREGWVYLDGFHRDREVLCRWQGGCGEMVGRCRQDWTEHWAKHHPNTGGPGICLWDGCQKSNKAMSKHVADVHCRVRVRCEECDQILARDSPDMLDRHRCRRRKNTGTS